MLHVVNLLGREGYNSVKFGKGYVDDFHRAAHIGTHLLHVAELLDGVAVTFLGYFGNLVHLGRNLIRYNHFCLGPVPLLGQAQTFHVLYVVGVVVERYVHVQLVESVHQHALLVKVGESQRTYHLGHAKLTCPGNDSIKQSL